jgi:baculoviral IAP repeat-containing protein 6
MNCCAEGRAIAIFETLGSFDRQYIAEKATSASRALAALAKTKSGNNHSVGPGGTGYGTGSGTGGSYLPASTGSREVSNNSSLKPTPNEQLAMHWEETLMRALNTLTELLPSPYAESAHAFDLLPHRSIGPLLSLSKLPELLGSLLRNDSVTDWIARGKTYHVMISLLRRMSDCELTVQVLIGQRWEMAKGPGLENWMWGEGDIVWAKSKDNVMESSPPLYEHFRKLTKQCEAFLAGASQIMDANGDENEEAEETMMQAASLCGDIIAAKGDMERVMSVLGVTSFSAASISDASTNNKGKGKGKNKVSSIELEQTYSLACEKLAFKHVMLGVDTGEKLNYAEYNFAISLEQTQDRIRNTKDRLHLIKELAVMATSLPPGVWVRVDEIRNDAMCGFCLMTSFSRGELLSAAKFLLLVLKELHTLAAYSNSIVLCLWNTPTRHLLCTCAQPVAEQ